MNVLVVFYSCAGETERLALSVGVGAIQAHASIRLRRLPPDPDVRGDQLTSAQRENFERMSRDYIAPRPVDADWADALVLATSRVGGRRLEAYVEQLPAFASIEGKIAAPMTADRDGSEQVLRPLYATSAAAGLIVAPMPRGPLQSVDAGTAFGRRVVALATALTAARPK